MDDLNLRDNFLGMRRQIEGIGDWPLLEINGCPSRMPRVSNGHEVACGIDLNDGRGEWIFWCETLEQMQVLHLVSTASDTANILWYQKPSNQLNN
jgi:hypothetical protein